MKYLKLNTKNTRKISQETLQSSEIEYFKEHFVLFIVLRDIFFGLMDRKVMNRVVLTSLQKLHTVGNLKDKLIGSLHYSKNL